MIGTALPTQPIGALCDLLDHEDPCALEFDHIGKCRTSSDLATVHVASYQDATVITLRNEPARRRAEQRGAILYALKLVDDAQVAGDDRDAVTVLKACLARLRAGGRPSAPVLFRAVSTSPALEDFEFEDNSETVVSDIASAGVSW